jgi:SAM-dependent methyltransferase
MLDRARALVAAAGATNCHLVVADAMTFDTVVPEPVDYVFLANTFHGVPDQLGLARTVVAILKPEGQFGVVNWHRRPREETVVLGQPRGPRTKMRIEACDVSVVVKPAGLLLNRTVEFPPYHYGAIFAKQGASGRVSLSRNRDLQCRDRRPRAPRLAPGRRSQRPGCDPNGGL